MREAGHELGLDNEILTRLIEPKEIIQMRLSPWLSDGHVHHMPAWIVRHSDILGPAKGGIRTAADVDQPMICALALEMTLKTALINVPFGGGKSGIRVDTKLLSPNDRERVIRSFVNAARRHLGPELYVPAPDMGTGEIEMGYIKDGIAYGEGHATTRGCYVTGKPVVLGGIPGRREATGLGVVMTLEAAAEELDLSINRLRVAIQGFGNVGSVVAQQLQQRGATIVAIGDVSGAVANEDGLDTTLLKNHIDQGGELKTFDGAHGIDQTQLLTTDCDVLVPAATSGVIDAAVASRIQARVIAEAANGPTRHEADTVLCQREKVVIPDILCNAGGVFVSYLEYTQETQRDQWTAEHVRQRLGQRMGDRFEAVWNSAKSPCELRQSAMVMAMKTLHEALLSRGLLA